MSNNIAIQVYTGSWIIVYNYDHQSIIYIYLYNTCVIISYHILSMCHDYDKKLMQVQHPVSAIYLQINTESMTDKIHKHFMTHIMLSDKEDKIGFGLDKTHLVLMMQGSITLQ